ncbi:MAG: GAF domain-containing protein [Gammaproteobacteria bacterium]|nr:GAF domain-containing protein [Gammaproteobacteria bacterium]
MTEKADTVLTKINLLNEVGIALSAERDFSSLLEQILIGAKHITNADGGTIYLLNANKKLEMVVVQTDSLNIHLGGNTDKPINFKPVNLYHDDGSPDLSMVVTRAVIEDKPINIIDAYNTQGYDFSGTYEFDKSTGYHSQSFLAVPMKNHENDVIGVLQLINAKKAGTNEIIPFSEEDQHLVESLASQAAVTIANKQLIDSLNGLFNSLVQLIATAIDEKSPHTSGHCKRLPVITMLIAEAAHNTEVGVLKEFTMNNDDRYELEVAAWLHDCGKLTTPEYVMDKSTKLERVIDRIEIIELRLEMMKKEAEFERLSSLVAGKDKEKVDVIYKEKIDTLNEAGPFLRHHNKGGEFMHEDDIEKVKQWAKLEWTDHDGTKHPLLNEDEVTNLCIVKGTLTDAEREIINNHIVATIKMLSTLPFPKHLQNVPEYAGGHHERVDGKGFPKGLVKEEMSVQARIMAIADIFEALTARDRPYKDPMKLSQAVSILKNMSETGHIDADLFDVFMEQSVHIKYANEYLLPEQNDL